MPFRTISKPAKVAENPVEFFGDLRPRKIAALYDQQAQLLRDYAAKAIGQSDVAIQGATGSGKTLVGLVIADWRRRKYGERPVYLCPTRQLVHQVATIAEEQLGLPAYAFVGSKHDYPPSEKSGWLGGDVLGVATYSAVFNISPFFSEPNFLVVDDAHAADQYIAEYWTIRLSGRDESLRPLFDALADLLSKVISPHDYARLTEEPRTFSDSLWVQMVPLPEVAIREYEISAIFDEVPATSDLGYRWHVLKGHLKAAQFFISPLEVVVRPIVPPTSTHRPFSGANQRLYMSATLGRGGELERLSGRKSIMRLPSPKGWDGHGVGRRFFVFPNSSLDESETARFLDELVLNADPHRALLLATDGASAEKYRERMGEELSEFTVYSARDIEQSKTNFVNDNKALAVIANRYDGIDFPDDECRLLIVSGRPSGMSSLERYLSERLGARALFAERTRTRIIQAFGRCTRSANDYAIVCIVGERLMDDLLRSEWRAGLDVELQAELKFGEMQSRDQSVDNLLELAKLFLEQGWEWKAEEENIRSLKDEMLLEIPSELSALEESAGHEINYVHALWGENYETALDAAQRAIGALSGGVDLRGYRGMWHYLAGCAAYLLAEERGGALEKANQHFRSARSIAGIRVKPGTHNVATNGESDNGLTRIWDEVAVQSLEKRLCELGLIRQQEFTGLEAAIRGGLQKGGKRFEAAHQQLGSLLGFDSQNSEGKGDPDPRWLIEDSLCIVFEDHIKETDASELPLNKARQAAAHPKWVQENIPMLTDEAEIIPVLVTNADASNEACRLHLQDVAVWPLDDFRRWAHETLRVVRSLRASLIGLGDLVWRAEAVGELILVDAAPSALLAKLRGLQ